MGAAVAFALGGAVLFVRRAPRLVRRAHAVRRRHAFRRRRAERHGQPARPPGSGRSPHRPGGRPRLRPGGLAAGVPAPAPGAGLVGRPARRRSVRGTCGGLRALEPRRAGWCRRPSRPAGARRRSWPSRCTGGGGRVARPSWSSRSASSRSVPPSTAGARTGAPGRARRRRARPLDVRLDRRRGDRRAPHPHRRLRPHASTHSDGRGGPCCPTSEPTPSPRTGCTWCGPCCWGSPPWWRCSGPGGRTLAPESTGEPGRHPRRPTSPAAAATVPSGAP